MSAECAKTKVNSSGRTDAAGYRFMRVPAAAFPEQEQMTQIQCSTYTDRDARSRLAVSTSGGCCNDIAVLKPVGFQLSLLQTMSAQQIKTSSSKKKKQ